jgi:hypothetical protein
MMPNDPEAEASVLGAILLDPGVIARAAELIEPDDFYRAGNHDVYEAMSGLHEAGQPIDLVTLANALRKARKLNSVGGAAHLALLQETVPTAANVEHHARIVREKAEQRRLVEAGREAITLGQGPALEPERVLELTARMRDSVEATGTLWEPPIPLAAAHELPAFPLERFPGWLAEYVHCLAEATQTPVDLPAMLALDALAAFAGGRVRLEVRPGWEEPLNLYTAVALPPGERKSAVFAEVTAPLANFEATMASERAYEIAAARARRKVAEKRLETLQNTAARAAAATERERRLEEVTEAARELEDIVVPAEFRLLADDATPEATASLLAEQRGRLAVLSPEGGVFGQMAGRYSSGGQPNLDVYLKGHSGDMLRVDRKGRAAEYVHQPALTVGLAVQPDVLRSLSDEPGFRGRGLLARFLFALPTSRVGGRRTDVEPLRPAVRETYAAELATLARSLEAAGTPHCRLGLSRRAEAALLILADDLEPRLGEGGDLSHVADWACKLVGAVGRVAGLLHLAGNVRAGWGQPVGPDAMEGAIEVGRYLIPHALAAFDLMEADPSLGLARRVLRWIADRGLTSFSRRDCFNVFRRQVGDRVAALDPALGLLETHGFVRRRAQEGGRAGRPRGPVFDVNPLSAKSAQSAKPGGSAGSFADIADSAPRQPHGDRA